VCFCFCVWFFAKRDEETGKRERFPCIIPQVVKITLLNFMGTIAFGSLIIAIIQMLRLVVAYVEYKKKEMEKAGTPIPWYWNCILKCCACYLWCLEKCMKYLNKNVYIMTILHDTWFCTSLYRVMGRMLGYISYILVTKPIATGMLFFGRVSIAFGTAAIGAYWASGLNVSSIVLPTVVMLVIGYHVASMCVEIFEMGIDTMLMCFLEAKHLGTDMHPDNIPPNLTRFMKRADDHIAKEKEEADGSHASGLAEGDAEKHNEGSA